MADNRPEILALLEQRMKDARAEIINSPAFKCLEARTEHLLWEHGSGECCTCPEWNDGTS